jgi:hypothetical protein
MAGVLIFYKYRVLGININTDRVIAPNINTPIAIVIGAPMNSAAVPPNKLPIGRSPIEASCQTLIILPRILSGTLV